MDLTFRERYRDQFGVKLITMEYFDNYYGQFCRPSLNWYNNGLLPLLKQFYLIPKRMNEIVDLRT
jgi:hypothetical protein